VPIQVSGNGAPSGTVSTLSGGTRSWWRVTGTLPASSTPVQLRWLYTTDPEYTGRGVNVSGVRVSSGGKTVLDGDRDPSAFTPVNWVYTDR
jgi:hypothetical protein